MLVMISTLLTMSRFLQFSMGWGLEGGGGGWGGTGAECGGVRCTVATPGQRHLHAYCTYMVVLQIHQESVHDLFSTKSHSIFFKTPFSYIYTVKTTKEKKHIPL